jgi:hypothetical protein
MKGVECSRKTLAFDVVKEGGPAGGTFRNYWRGREGIHNEIGTFSCFCFGISPIILFTHS